MEVDVVTDPDVIKKVIPVIKSAWGMENMDQLVKDILCSFRFHGGLVLVARDGDETVGMHYSYPGFRGGKVYLYSHMTGVLENRKYEGIGAALKLEQKKWALQHGYKLIIWTYDPLMSLNARFNTHKLGTVSRTYLRNFYGEMEDPLNSGFPTDRFVTEWHLDQDRFHTSEHAQEIKLENSEEIALENLTSCVSVEIPKNYLQMKKENKDMAMKIRLSTRNLFERLFKMGYVVTDYEPERSSYILLNKDPITDILGKNIFL